MALQTLDTYTLKTRYYPTLIGVAPICLCFLTMVVAEYGLLSGLPVTLISGLGLGLLMDQVGRDKGRKKQSRLFAKWGGMPTTVYLRHRDAHINPASKARYHTILNDLLPDLALPSKEQEAGTRRPGSGRCNLFVLR